MPKINVKKNIKVDDKSKAENVKVNSDSKKAGCKCCVEEAFDNFEKSIRDARKAEKEVVSSLLGFVEDFAVHELKRANRIKREAEIELVKTSSFRVFKRRDLKKKITTINEMIDMLETIVNDKNS